MHEGLRAYDSTMDAQIYVVICIKGLHLEFEMFIKDIL